MAEPRIESNETQSNAVEMLFLNIACDLDELNTQINSPKYDEKDNTTTTNYDEESNELTKIPSCIAIIRKTTSQTEVEQSDGIICKTLSNNNRFYEVCKSKSQVQWYNKIYHNLPEKYNDQRLTLTRIAEIDPRTDANHIFNLMQQGISTFLYDMQNSSLDECKQILSNIDHCMCFMSHIKNTQLTYSKIIKISPRLPRIGQLADKYDKILLKPRDNIIITADRRFAKRGSPKAVFINCRHFIRHLKCCDIIQFGDIKVKVVKCKRISVECIVANGGELSAGLDVILPEKYQTVQVSFEELEDITFAMEYGINFITTSENLDIQNYNKIHNVLKLLKCEWIRIIAYVNESEIVNTEIAKFLPQKYCGIILNCKNCLNNKLIDFNEDVRTMIELCYENKKSLILSWNKSNLCNIKDTDVCVTLQEMKYLFHYPEGILVSCQNLSDDYVFNSIFKTLYKKLHCYNFQQLKNQFIDQSYTGSDTIAKAIVRTSYNCSVAAIILCTSTGRMAIKISHFRPKCPIIALTKSSNSIRYIHLYQNIFAAQYKGLPDEQKTSTRQDALLRKLFYGITYGANIGLITNNDTIMFCFKSPANFGYANKFVLFKVDVPLITQLIQEDVI